jgi:hypothetical protein
MFPPKAQLGSTLRFTPLISIACAALAIATLCALVSAQERKTLTIIMLDGKTGKPIKPSNYIVRFDYHDATRNEGLRLDDEGVGTVYLPPEVSTISVQGTYLASMEIYLNCDAAMEKDTSTIHWYKVAEILTSGVNAPNECFKGKYAEATHLNTKPGTFIFYVRPVAWHDIGSD